MATCGGGAHHEHARAERAKGSGLVERCQNMNSIHHKKANIGAARAESCSRNEAKGLFAPAVSRSFAPSRPDLTTDRPARLDAHGPRAAPASRARSSESERTRTHGGQLPCWTRAPLQGRSSLAGQELPCWAGAPLLGRRHVPPAARTALAPARPDQRVASCVQLPHAAPPTVIRRSRGPHGARRWTDGRTSGAREARAPDDARRRRSRGYSAASAPSSSSSSNQRGLPM